MRTGVRNHNPLRQRGIADAFCNAIGTAFCSDRFYVACVLQVDTIPRLRNGL